MPNLEEKPGKFRMSGADQRILVHHMAFYGLGDILHTQIDGVTLRWESGKPCIEAANISPEIVESAVRECLTGRGMWVDKRSGPEKRATMSPRLTPFKSTEAWRAHQNDREKTLDSLTAFHAWDDLRYLAALGEPSYWHRDFKGVLLQDAGASRFEMQPRNRGSEFVGNRLRPLSEKLPTRKAGLLAAGLTGESAIDELGGNPDSVSATGMTTPGAIDNALVWCALWGIGQFPIAPRLTGNAVTSGHLTASKPRREWFYVPVWEGRWRVPRLRTILASAQLRDAAVAGISDLDTDDVNRSAASDWLRARGVRGIVRFPVGRFGSDNAPERRALNGEPIPIQAATT
ncbi:hypothetical protein ACFU44_06070 [Nocardia rhizosphaerihabitans]|uniref:hypothetical protein n=1 Tax=Nocardia rhizosphaerihabitans TaxID=1691570 RepID=UPI003672D848